MPLPMMAHARLWLIAINMSLIISGSRLRSLLIGRKKIERHTFRRLERLCKVLQQV